MAFRFEHGETFLTGIPRIARENISSVIKLLSEKPRPTAESVHEARKSLKALRAVLQLARGGIETELKNRENILFRDTGRSLSAARDPQALLEVLDRIGKSRRTRSRRPTAKKRADHDLIGEIRQEINQQILGQLGHEPVQDLVKELQDAKRRTASWLQGILLQPGNEWEVLIGTGLRRTYRKARNLVSLIEQAGHQSADDEAWHELRKCAKALGYQLRLLEPIWATALGALIDEIDELTSRLGDANDLAVLQNKVLEKAASNRDKDELVRREFMRSIARRKQKLRLRALKYARIIYSEKPRQFERRLAGYWQIWRTKGTAPESGIIENNDGPGKRLRSKASGVLAGCFE
jgi:CHAD domain-containing protein